MLVGTIWNPAGLILAKTVPVARAEAFVTGLGASPTWNAFASDRGTAFTAAMGTIGDHRLRLDPDAVRIFADGLAWGPATMVTQAGEPLGECTRSALRRAEDRLASAGITALVGHELEFTLFDADGSPLPPDTWAPYSLAGVVRFEAFVREVYTRAAEVDLALEHVHAEFGPHQLECSLAPRTPVAAADDLVLARLIIGRAARATGLIASFSPKPLTDSVGNGAHQHVSLARDGAPLLSGGDGPHGLTRDGGAAIAGIVGALHEIQAALAGSILSCARLLPGTWAGAFAAWGLENREVAVRLIAGDAAAANLEVKVIDPSTSGYLASAAMLGAALRGVEDALPMPTEAAGDPGDLSAAAREAAGIVALATVHMEAITALEGSELARRILGSPLVDAVVAVRRHEHQHHGDASQEQLIDRFRFAWSV
ncbi:L-glutamine synthetase [Agrococcus baldri]|uniref:L-glutamine synthetase n=2 Tax=Agrococcus baldri TaxID=153730 RepID=A0AA94HPR4_9MICO|nr:L-glutamine synthetase [Agrococcus baldri]